MKKIESGCVLITGADTPTGLTTARALRALPIEIVGTFSDTNSVTIASSHWDQTLYTPGDAGDQLDYLLDEARSGYFGSRCVLLFSQDSHIIEAWARLSELRQYFIVPIPDRSDCETMMDKTLFHQWATDHGVGVPKSQVLNSLDQLKTLSADVNYPCILKPLVRSSTWDNAFENRKFFFLNDKNDLEGVINNTNPFLYSPRYILQEWIPGEDKDVFFVLFALDEKSRVLSSYAGQKIWQWPPLGGSTAICRLVDNDELVALATRIATSLKMVGLGSIEFKRDPRTGQFLVTEPTVARNDYQSGVALIGGNNPTVALIRHCLNIPAPSVSRKHRTCTWFDELATYRYMKYQRFFSSSLNLLSTLLTSRRIRFLLFEIRDPKPFLKKLKKVLERNWK